MYLFKNRRGEYGLAWLGDGPNWVVLAGIPAMYSMGLVVGWLVPRITGQDTCTVWNA
jgi:hypothetical protein